jgi:hypothetical protein
MYAAKQLAAILDRFHGVATFCGGRRGRDQNRRKRDPEAVDLSQTIHFIPSLSVRLREFGRFVLVVT